MTKTVGDIIEQLPREEADELLAHIVHVAQREYQRGIEDIKSAIIDIELANE